MLITNMLYLVFPSAMPTPMVHASSEMPAAASSGITAEKFADIKRKIEQHLPLCQNVRGKDITVILGNCPGVIQAIAG